MAGRWLDIQSAALELGLSTDAVRKRVHRGTLTSEERDGRRVVWLDDGGTEAGHGSTERGADDRQLVEELRRHNEYLQGQVEAEREARLRADHIIARLSESNAELSRTVRELEGASGPTVDNPQEGQQEAAERPAATDPGDTSAPASGEAHTGAHEPRRSLWRRLLGR